GQSSCFVNSRSSVRFRQSALMQAAFSMYRPRSHRLREKSDTRLLFRLILTVVLIVAFIVAFFLWGIPFLISLSEFSGSYGKQDIIPQAAKAPLAPPRLESLPIATNAATMDIRGFGSAGMKVILRQNDETVGEKFIGSDGIFVFDKIVLEGGKNTFGAVLKNEAGEQSEPTDPVATVLDQTPPPLSLSEPANGSSFPKEQKSVTVQGKSEAGTSITVNGRWAVVNPAGEFSEPVLLNEGANTITILASDLAGNSVSVVRTVTLSS
ncbi:MAG: hypothetical protein Q8R11_00135, partial [bacterium]|nr:hypothetical protein [bacterium]